MGERFPFFYYDIVARIIPAAVLLCVLSLIGLDSRMLVNWAWSASKSSASPGLLEPAVLAVIYLGLCYAIGVAFEVLPYVLLLRGVLEACLDQTFCEAVQDRSWRRSPESPSPSQPIQLDTRALRRHCWNWLELQPRAGLPRAFAHAHRFSAESKMFQYFACTALILPAAAFIRLTLVELTWCPAWWGQPAIPLPHAIYWSLCLAFGFICAVYWRERRRWVQVLDAVDELHKPEDQSDELWFACEHLRESLQEKKSFRDK